MKRIIGIWLGVIALVLVVGIVFGVVEKRQALNSVPEDEYIQVTVGYDENNNPIIKEVIKDEVTVKIDGDLYTYNTGAFKSKKFSVEGIEFDFDFNRQEFIDQGFEVINATQLKKNNSTVVMNYSISTGKGIAIQAYAPQFLECSNTIAPTCESFELPSGIKLGKSTFEEVQALYGVSKVYPSTKSTLTTTKYYLDETKTAGFIIMSFNDEGLLCKIDVNCKL